MLSGWMRAVLLLAILILSASVGVGQPWPLEADLFGPRKYEQSRNHRVERPSRQVQSNVPAPDRPVGNGATAQAPSAAVEPRALPPPEPLAASNNQASPISAPDYRSLRDNPLQTR